MCTGSCGLPCPRSVELLHCFAVCTFPGPWRAQPCFHTLQHGGTRDPSRAAPALTSDAVRPLRLLIGRKWAVPPPRIQRRLTREPHVTEVGQCRAESQRVYLTRLFVLPHFPDAPPRGLPSFSDEHTAWTSRGLTKNHNKIHISNNFTV